jgi:hypothetical protein
MIQLFYVYITFASWQALYPIGSVLTLYGLTECIMNEWMNERLNELINGFFQNTCMNEMIQEEMCANWKLKT